ncbi:hypothetical protein FAIPA1_20261 [Frankia sp. AiPs1]
MWGRPHRPRSDRRAGAPGCAPGAGQLDGNAVAGSAGVGSVSGSVVGSTKGVSEVSGARGWPAAFAAALDRYTVVRGGSSAEISDSRDLASSSMTRSFRIGRHRSTTHRP